MSLTIGTYHGLLNSVHAKVVEPISFEGIKEIECCIDELAFVLDGDFNWVVTGGLAIPLTTGEFYRAHRDIDIGVAQNDLDKLVETAHEHGYDFFERVLMTKLTKKTKLDVYKEKSSEQAVNGRHLRLVKVDTRGHPVCHTHLLDYIDVFVHHFENGELVSNDGSITIPADTHGVSYETVSGMKINIRSLEYIMKLKQHNMNAINKYDIETLSSL